MRVPLFLSECQIPFDTLLHPPAFTANKRAKYLHVPGRQLAKCVLLSGPDNKVLAVLPATRQVDTDSVCRALGATYRLANDREVGEVFRDCEWGALAPFGTLYGVATILDEEIDPETWIIFQTHAHGVAIRMRCRDFEQLEKPRRFAFGRPATTNCKQSPAGD
jgi:Ala-tRNA(Pro) deacylase